MVTETNNEVVEETPTKEQLNAETAPGNPVPKEPTNLEKAQMGLKEIYEKYGIGEYHMALAFSENIEKKIHVKAANNKLIREERENRLGLTEYHELIARDITAMKVIDNHNQEMQQYERNVIDTVVGWLNTNKSEAANEMVQIMCAEIGLPYTQIVNKLNEEINQQVLKQIGDIRNKIINEVTETERIIYADSERRSIISFSTMSKKEQKAYLANLSK